MISCMEDNVRCELEKAIASAHLGHEVDITIITNGGLPWTWTSTRPVKALTPRPRSPKRLSFIPGITNPVLADKAAYKDWRHYAPCPERTPCRRRGKTCSFQPHRCHKDRPASGLLSSRRHEPWRFRCHGRKDKPDGRVRSSGLPVIAVVWHLVQFLMSCGKITSLKMFGLPS